MRTIPADIANKLALTKQTKANSADISASLWIGRPTTALTNDTFLERQTVLNTPTTDVSIAVGHPRRGSGNTRINVAYVSNGVAHVATALAKTRMSSHVWADTGFSESASAVSIAYDGTMPKGGKGQVEFVTETQPWMFWVQNGALYTRKLGTSATITLAESNCTDVSAIRAMWSEVGGFDFGLCVFFLLSGSLYYRQLIDGEWKDAEVVGFGPSGAVWSEIAAFRTWDYRVGVQAKTTGGDIYELFTQFMGVGKQNVEHLEIRNVKASGEMTKINYHDTSETEHLEITGINAGALYGGLYLLSIPVLTAAWNADNGAGDWGIVAYFRFDVHLKSTEVAAQPSAFGIADSRGVLYSPSVAELQSDGKTVKLTFTNFNNARGECAAKYAPGTVTTMADVAMTETSCVFTPENLVPVYEPVPEVQAIWNE